MVVNIAHRGASAYYTENTISAVKEAIYQKADMIEVDIRFTKDHVPVLSHDATLYRLAKKHVYIHSLTLDQLKAFKINHKEQITTLEDFLDISRGRIGIVLDVKENNNVKAIVNLIKSRNMESKVIFSSPDIRELKKVKRLDPKIRVAIVYRLKLGIIEKARHAKAYSIHPYHLAATNSLIRSAHKHKIKVFPYTVNRSKRMKQLINAGVDGMITNKPVLLRNVIHNFPHNRKL